ncbi:MAG: MFS transporter [Alphaproteobacteria bacterium]|nr:MFS transporter [Alphaproteobacteria bacterium]
MFIAWLCFDIKNRPNASSPPNRISNAYNFISFFTFKYKFFLKAGIVTFNYRKIGMIQIKPNNKLSVFSWCLYDWANTAFGTVIITFIFSVYFAREIVGDETLGSAQWSFAISVSGFVIAVLGPVLGAIADHSGRRKFWIFILSLLCIFPCAALWGAVPGGGEQTIFFVLLLVALANVGFELAQVFYNAMLPHIAQQNRIGRISGWAWGFGYLGGLTALAVTLFGFIGFGDVKPFIDLPRENFEHIRVSGPVISLWFFVFMLPLFLFVSDKKTKNLSVQKSITLGLRQLMKTLKNIKEYKNIALFLISSAIYRDGLVTLFAIGGVYAAGQYGMGFSDILIFAIGLNVTAGLGAFIFAYIDDWAGPKRTIVTSLLGLIAFGTAILFVQDKNTFIILSLGLGIFIGPVQAASRTMVGKISPPSLITQSYGLYAMTGKSVSFLGPLLFGLAVTAFGTQQAGMISIILFWLVGLLLLLWIKEEKVNE